LRSWEFDVPFFRKAAPAEPLAVTMAGVKLGDRFLAVGLSDPALIAALAIKSGLTGEARAIDPDEARVEKARMAIEQEGALVEVTRAPWGLWPFDAESVDVTTIINLLPALPADARARVIGETLRVLRPGGRAIVIEPARRGGFGALLHRETIDSSYDGPMAALKAEGFVAVRVLAEAGGSIFVEGIKKA
jgi:ubiquinone/menaquinone biosynthesis C-methylase UbiE